MIFVFIDYLSHAYFDILLYFTLVKEERQYQVIYPKPNQIDHVQWDIFRIIPGTKN